MTGALEMWVVYDRPNDFPGKVVARRWLVDTGGNRPTDGIRVADNLDDVRAALRLEGLTPIARSRGDDPAIVETWL